MLYRGYVLQRVDIVNMRGILMEKVNETMKKSVGLFRSIMPPKIFTDMYQFF